MSRVTPAEFRRYVLSLGWTEQPEAHPKLLVFCKQHEGVEVAVDCPSRVDFSDYERRMMEAFEILSRVEGLSMDQITCNLQKENADIILFRFDTEQAHDGSLSLDDALRLREGRRQLLLSAAHSALEPLRHFPRLSRAEPLEFLSGCRELLPQRGSYLSEVAIPVAPALGSAPVEAPFARRVTETFAWALGAAVDALEEGRASLLLEGAAQGLSSNFLAALGRLYPPQRQGALELSVRWASARPGPSLARQRVRLEARFFPALEEAARVLRETTPQEDCQLEGYIAQLERDHVDPSQPGSVLLISALEDRAGSSKIHIELPPELYRIATEAHAQAAAVRLTGTLVQQGRKLTLREPSGLRLVARG